jgi:hypothetical protein
LRFWNALRSERREPAVGLWIPVNVRRDPLAGFGNGSSRVRVYNRCEPMAKLRDKSRSLRQQMDWSRSHGEWWVPESAALTRFPMHVLRSGLRAYFNRPWVDMGTATFSHLQRSPLDAEVFRNVASAELVGVLDKRHALGLFAMSRAGTTWLTFVYDAEQLKESSVAQVVSLYREQLCLAAAGL